MRNVITLGVILMVICAVAAGALAATNNVTAPIIQAQEAQKVQESLKEVLPNADEFEEQKDLQLPEGVQSVYFAKSGGEDVGIIAVVSPSGYGGPVSIMVGIENEGKISAVRILSHSETAGLGAKITEPSFYEQFTGQSVDKELKVSKDGGEIDAISAATISSRAVTNGVNRAIEIFNNLK